MRVQPRSQGSLLPALSWSVGRVRENPENEVHESHAHFGTSLGSKTTSSCLRLYSFIQRLKCSPLLSQHFRVTTPEPPFPLSPVFLFHFIIFFT